MLQTSMSNPKISDLKTAQKLFRRLKETGDPRLEYIDVRYNTVETLQISRSRKNKLSSAQLNYHESLWELEMTNKEDFIGQDCTIILYMY